MTADIFYPPIDDSTVKGLRIIAELLKKHKAYFLDSPYSKQVEDFCKMYLSKEIKDHSGDVDFGDWAEIVRENISLYNSLKASKPSSADQSELMSYYKTSAQLMEKIITLKERAAGMHQIHMFQHAVLEAMENVLTPEQRPIVMERLKASLVSN